MKKYNLVVIGGGPAGMAVALSAHAKGVKNILVIERDKELGGILNQCIHNGFGLHHFKEELTGPEYSTRYIDEIKKTDIDFLTDSMVLHIDDEKNVHAINSASGYMKISTQSIALAMGCRERTRGAINIYGSRPAGVYTAGTAQRLINLDGYLPGKKVVILGSGDIGLIMARRMTLEGAKVEAVVELMPHSSGLPKNIVECLDDYQIPLLLSHTVIKVHGKNRVDGVTIAKVNERREPIKGSEQSIECDTLLLSVGLIPENEISRMANVEIDVRTNGPVVGELRQTTQEGVFACGNVLHVHDIVDFVSEEGALAGEGVVHYLNQQLDRAVTHKTINGEGVSYVIPQHINVNNIVDDVKIYLRVNNVFDHHLIKVFAGEKMIAKKKEIKFLPAQMVSIKLKKKDLLDSLDSELVVQVSEQ